MHLKIKKEELKPNIYNFGHNTCRYVREWLGIMVCGGIIDLDATSQTFLLPHHRRPYFTPGCKDEGYSLMMRCVPMLATAFDEVGRCLQTDGPIGKYFITGNQWTQSPCL